MFNRKGSEKTLVFTAKIKAAEAKTSSEKEIEVTYSVGSVVFNNQADLEKHVRESTTKVIQQCVQNPKTVKEFALPPLLQKMGLIYKDCGASEKVPTSTARPGFGKKS